MSVMTRLPALAVGLIVAVLVVGNPSRAAVINVFGLSRDDLGQQKVPSLPAQGVNVQVSEATLPAEGEATTHSHALGWIYVLQGTHILTVGDRKIQIPAGQAAWIPDGIEHTHDWDRSQPHKYWSVEIGMNQPSTVPERVRLIGSTQILQGLKTAGHTVHLRRYTQPATAPFVATGTGFGDTNSPKVLIGLSGTAEVIFSDTPAPPGRPGHPSVPQFASQRLAAEQVLTLQPLRNGHLLVNVAGQPYSVLVLLVTPD